MTAPDAVTELADVETVDEDTEDLEPPDAESGDDDEDIEAEDAGAKAAPNVPPELTTTQVAAPSTAKPVQGKRSFWVGASREQLNKEALERANDMSRTREGRMVRGAVVGDI